MIDNFEHIIPLLKFEKEHNFYFLQIIQRRKDHPSLDHGDRIIKSYYLRSDFYLTEYRDEIIGLCKYFGARAMIHLNSRNLKDIGNLLGKTVSQLLYEENFSLISRAYESTCGKHTNEKEKKYIIDIDTKDEIELNNINKFLEELTHKPKIYTTLNTKNGYHMITSGFDVNMFKKTYPKIEIKDDSPTNLYIP